MRDGHSSLYARNRFLHSGTTFEEATGLPLPGHAPFGGAVPLVTVDGWRGWVIVSGLTQEEDYEFAVDGIKAAQTLAAAQRSALLPHVRLKIVCPSDRQAADMSLAPIFARGCFPPSLSLGDSGVGLLVLVGMGFGHPLTDSSAGRSG